MCFFFSCPRSLPPSLFFFSLFFFFFLMVCNGKYKLKLIQHCFFFYMWSFPRVKRAGKRTVGKPKPASSFFFSTAFYLRSFSLAESLIVVRAVASGFLFFFFLRGGSFVSFFFFCELSTVVYCIVSRHFFFFLLDVSFNALFFSVLTNSIYLYWSLHTQQVNEADARALSFSKSGFPPEPFDA